jgi:hypothetical protein
MADKDKALDFWDRGKIYSAARLMWKRGDVDGAGTAIGLPRITMVGGHPFDESDASYKLRVNAWLDALEPLGAAGPREEDNDDEGDASDSDHSPDNSTENP